MFYKIGTVASLLIGSRSLPGCYRRQRQPIARSRWTCSSVLCICLIVLASCGSTGGTVQTHKNKPTPTPTNTPRPTATATTPANPDGKAPTDWITYHRDNARSGYSAGTPDPQQLTKAWSSNLDGAVYAEPLVVAGHVIVATENDTIYSLDAQSGNVQWHTNVGTPVPLSTLPCGDIDPLGITGTPVYDPATGLVFAVAEVSGPQHILVGVDINSGNVRVHRVVDVPGMDPRVHQQRAALALSQGKVYIAYGGLDGDCGNYHGTVVASQTDGQGQLLSYQVPTGREGGIWGTSGPSTDDNGQVYVSVGNGESTGGDWDKTDSVLRLSSTLQYQDGFAPTTWAQDNAADADLGSMGPVLLPNGLIFIAGKSSAGYVLHANALGGVGGQVSQGSVCGGEAMGGAAWVNSQIFVPCTGGLRKITIGADMHITVNWSSGGGLSPVVGGNTVYSFGQNGTLYAFDSNSGSQRASIAVGAIPHFISPTISGNHLFVGTNTGVTAITIS